MVRALVWKEWRKLRGLRWACAAMSLALPVALFLASHASTRGWGLAALSGYSSRTLLFEVVPAALALALWPLTAMLMTVSALTADRAEGTESFLLDRPVPRARVWWARVGAALGSLLAVVLAGGALVLALAAGEGGVPRLGWRGMALLVLGAVLVLAAVVAALGATSLVSAPLPALLLALVFAGFPLLAGLGGSAVFPHAVWQRIPLAALTACAIGLSLPLASWVADTRGEPAGRGRRLRAGLVLGAGFALSALLFVVLAPAAVRASAQRGRFLFAPPAAGASTLAYQEQGGGFVLDLANAEENAFLVPEVTRAAWDPAGERLALLDESGPLGSVGPPRIRFLDRGGREIWPALDQPEEGALDLAWAGDRLLVLRASLDGTTLRHRVALLDPASGRETVVVDGVPVAALHTLADGRAFVATGDGLARGATREEALGSPWVLRPVDVERGALGAPVLAGRGMGYLFPGLSPSGRYWMRLRSSDGPALLEIGSGRSLPLPITAHAVPRWLRHDEVVWLDREGKAGAWSLVGLRPGEPARSLASGVTRNAALLISPDGSRVLVLTPDFGFLGATLIDLQERTALPPLPQVTRGRVAWAGPRTLGILRRGGLELYDVETGRGKVVF